MKRLLISAIMAAFATLAPFVAVAAFLAFVWLLMNFAVITLGVVVFGVFTYLWVDAYKFLD